jgi:hypothetical protein
MWPWPVNPVVVRRSIAPHFDARVHLVQLIPKTRALSEFSSLQGFTKNVIHSKGLANSA